KEHFAIQVQREPRERDDEQQRPGPQTEGPMQIEIHLRGAAAPAHLPTLRPAAPPRLGRRGVVVHRIAPRAPTRGQREIEAREATPNASDLPSSAASGT